jgi:peptidoglycan hydrolase CwlO-like protein
MRRRLILIFTALTFAFTSLIATLGTSHVEANSTLQNKINSIKEERTDNQSELKQKEDEIKTLEKKMQQLEGEIKDIDHKTAATNQQIREKDKEIDSAKKRIEELVEEIQILETRIAERDELLKNRVRSMYVNGGSVNYLEVVLGAKNFGDLINRISALSTIAQQDRNILEAHHNDKLMVEEVKGAMEQELISLEGKLADLESLKKQLNSQRKEKDRLMTEHKQQEGELHAELGELENADQILAAQERAMKQELEAWKERQRQLAEQERKRKEEEKKRKEEAARSGIPYTPPAPAPSTNAEGKFMRPATGTLTSPYGARWGKMHHGVDIGKNGRQGDVPVVAAEAGTVISSYYSSSYGNTVMISHNVNGKVVTTLYAHLENRFVSEGQRVSRGQLLGYMGNTGRSFGAHLHFEVHEGPWNNSKSNSVDPLRYIPR